MKISTREIYSLNDEKMSGLNIQQLITVQVSWWCIDNFTIINQECFMCQLPTAHTVHIPTHHQWSLGLHKNKTWMIDHHISHTVPFDKITKCAQVKAINISRVRSSSCFPNVTWSSKQSSSCPRPLPIAAAAEDIVLFQLSCAPLSLATLSILRCRPSWLFHFTSTVLVILDLNIRVHFLFCPKFWT